MKKTADEVRLDRIEKDQDKLAVAIIGINDSLKTLIRLEEIGKANTDTLKRAFDRLEVVERAMVGADGNEGLIGSLRQMRDRLGIYNWVVKGIAGATIAEALVWISHTISGK